MDQDDFWLLWKGFNDKIVYELELVRRQTAILYYAQPNYGKGNRTSFEKIWPSVKSEMPTDISRAKKRLQEIREQRAKYIQELKESSKKTVKRLKELEAYRKWHCN